MRKAIFATIFITVLLILAACAETYAEILPNPIGVTNENPTNVLEETPPAAIQENPETGLKETPTLTIKYWAGGALLETNPYKGVANWFLTNYDGTTMGVMTDSAHPLQAIPHLPVIDRAMGGVGLLDLFFNIPPDDITAKRWVIDDMGAAEYSGYTNVFVAGTTINVPDSDNNYVYEITARWYPNNFGTFAFFVTASPPVVGPRRTPQLYVSLKAEGCTPQYFQALQLSNNWWPSAGDIDSPLAGGYCATSYHPLDVWARDFLAELGWDDDAVTFRLGGGSGEVELGFSDDFLPHTVYVRRWPAEFAALTSDGGSNMDLWFAYEAVEVFNNVFAVSDDGNDYIYEVEALWRQGRSSYAFRVDSR